jgi:perosamine synthetase
MAKKYALSDLAINGGTPVRNKPWPPRRLFGLEEKEAVDALFDAAIASGNAFGYEGPTERAYCEEFAEYLGGGYVDAVNAGTTAVYVGLKAINPEPYTEIIVSPITDQGGLMPIPLLNCIPVVADAAPGSFNMGPEQVEAILVEQNDEWIAGKRYFSEESLQVPAVKTELTPEKKQEVA